jgi:hypothetical protein
MKRALAETGSRYILGQAGPSAEFQGIVPRVSDQASRESSDGEGESRVRWGGGGEVQETSIKKVKAGKREAKRVSGSSKK